MWPSLLHWRLISPSRVGFAGGMLLLFVGLAGLVTLERYQRTPGVAAPPPVSWPDDTSLVWRTERVNIVVAVHPKCPCTRASVSSLLSQSGLPADRAHFHFLFLQPDGFAESWHEGPLWTRAEAPNATRVVDRDGRLATRFGALTSGAVAAYRPDGSLAFHGGVTSARGQDGPSAGLSALAHVVNDSPARPAARRASVEARPDSTPSRAACPRSTPVFGCPMCRCESSRS